MPILCDSLAEVWEQFVRKIPAVEEVECQHAKHTNQRIPVPWHSGDLKRPCWFSLLARVVRMRGIQRVGASPGNSNVKRSEISMAPLVAATG